MHAMTLRALAPLILVVAAEANGGTCISPAPAPTLTIKALLQDAPFEEDVTVEGCYLGTRHGISLHDCDTGFGSGLWLDLDDALKQQPEGRKFLASSFRMPALREPPVLHVRATGRLTHTDDYVPGGAVFTASALLCFDPISSPSRSPSGTAPGDNTSLAMDAPLGTESHSCIQNDPATPFASLQDLPIGATAKVAACYHSSRHGSSLRDCDSPEQPGVRAEISDSIRPTAAVRALSEGSGAQWTPNSKQVISVQVSGHFEPSDLDVPGGKQFLITQLHCLEILPDSQPAPTAPDASR